jgi:hypothetical protein
MKKVIDMNPFFGLTYEDENGLIYKSGDGLTEEESKRIDEYFSKFFNNAFSYDKSKELAQMALDNIPIPEGWRPQ